MSPKRAPTTRPGRDRFTAESYTVLGKNTHSYKIKSQKMSTTPAVKETSGSAPSEYLIELFQVDWCSEERQRSFLCVCDAAEPRTGSKQYDMYRPAHETRLLCYSKL